MQLAFSTRHQAASESAPAQASALPYLAAPHHCLVPVRSADGGAIQLVNNASLGATNCAFERNWAINGGAVSVVVSELASPLLILCCRPLLLLCTLSTRPACILPSRPGP